MKPIQRWEENGKLHRPWQEGPAIVWQDTYEMYFEHGKRHRPVSDGPAVTYATGFTEYWEHGVFLWTVQK